jgi:molecular chaperone DnaK (HSP70)
MILMKTKESAELYLESTVTKAVVTIPAGSDHFKREAIMDAAAKSGLRIICTNEATAAASPTVYTIIFSRSGTFLFLILGEVHLMYPW